MRDEDKALLVACATGSLEDVKAALSTANINVVSDEGWTPLTIAARDGRHLIVELLLENGADINLPKSDSGATALYIAICQGHIPVIKCLLRHAGIVINKPKHDGNTPLDAAKARGDLPEDIVRLLQAKTKPEAEAKSEPTRAELLARKRKVKDKRAALLAACATGDRAFARELAGGSFSGSIAKLVDGRSPLLEALANKQFDLAERMVIHGAKVDLVDEKGYSLLHYALQKAAVDGQFGAADWLIAHGAKVEHTDKKGGTLLYRASEAGQLPIMEYLLQHGAVVNRRTKDGSLWPLFCAAEHGHAKAVACLLKYGSLVNEAHVSDGRAPLHAAAQKGHLPVVQCLVENGANLNAVYKNKSWNSVTAILIAAGNGHIHVIQYLVRAGADFNLAATSSSDGEKLTPAKNAERREHMDVASYLMYHAREEQEAAAKFRVQEEEDKKYTQEVIRRLILIDTDKTKLDLTGVKITNGGYQLLISTLTSMTSLEEITLTDCKLTEGMLKGILAVLQHNHAVTEINVTGENELTAELLAQFAALTMRNEEEPPAPPASSVLPPAPAAAAASPAAAESKPQLGALPIVPFSMFTPFGKRLGEGAFGEVYKAEYEHQPVAVKKLKLARLSGEALKEFTNEAGIMANLRHANIVQLLAICIDESNYCMIMEFMERGTLCDLLHGTEELSMKSREEIAKQIAVGLSVLHEHNILHRDLKSPNVLLNKHMEAKLSDFGLAKVRSETTAGATTAGGVVGTIAWMAPECFSRSGKVSDKTDIYALGMVFWELMSRKIPFADAVSPVIMMGWIQSGEQELIPVETPELLAKLIKQCWNKDPASRPGMPEIRETLDRLIADEVSVVRVADAAAPTAADPSYRDGDSRATGARPSYFFQSAEAGKPVGAAGASPESPATGLRAS